MQLNMYALIERLDILQPETNACMHVSQLDNYTRQCIYTYSCTSITCRPQGTLGPLFAGSSDSLKDLYKREAVAKLLHIPVVSQ
jgi:hypothetical protein